MIEREIKLRVADPEALRNKLRSLGWSVERGPYAESNTLYDNSERSLRAAGKLLRVRRIPGKAVLTVKGPSLDGGPHKAREEREVVLAEDADIGALLGMIGFEPAWRYDKRRTRYSKDGEAGVVELDETPIGDIVELEGEADWIDHTAAALGYRPEDYITASYRELFLSTGGDAGDMVFEQDPPPGAPRDGC